MLKAWLKPLYEEDDPSHGGGDDLPPRASDLLTRFGRDADAALRLAEELAKVQGEAYRLRDQRRQLRADLAAAKAAAAPDGARVLTADEAQAYDAYQALGKPDALKASLEQAQAASADLATMRRQEAIRAAADAHGYKAAALGKLPSLTGKDVVLKDILQDGATVKAAFVDDMPLGEYIAQHDPELMGALKDTTAAPPSGTLFVAQGGANDQKAGDLASRFIEQQTQRRANDKNPLMRG